MTKPPNCPMCGKRMKVVDQGSALRVFRWVVLCHREQPHWLEFYGHTREEALAEAGKIKGQHQ